MRGERGILSNHIGVTENILEVVMLPLYLILLIIIVAVLGIGLLTVMFGVAFLVLTKRDKNNTNTPIITDKT